MAPKPPGRQKTRGAQRAKRAAPAAASAPEIKLPSGSDEGDVVLRLSEQLEELQERYALLWDDAPVAYVMLDAHGVIVEANGFCADLLGESDRQYSLPRRPFIVYVFRPDMKIFLDHLLSTAARGAGVAELRLRPRNAAAAPRPVQLVTQRLLGVSVAAPRYFMHVLDVSELHRSERALRASEKRYREIVDTSAEGICIIGLDHLISFANRRLAAMLRTPVDELVGRPIFGHFPPDQRESVRRALAEAEHQTVLQTEHRLLRADGSALWVSISASTIRDGGDSISGMLLMFTDISTRQQLRETREAFMHDLVAAQERERQRIARELHDEMGQHIVAIAMELSRLGVLVNGNPQATAIIDKLRSETDILGRDVHHLALELRPAALDHLGCAPAIASYSEQLASRSGLDIDVHCDDSQAIELAPEAQIALYRIAQEALTNVAKHAHARHVSVILERLSESVQLIVEDDGRGFDPTQLSRRQTKQHLGMTGMQERAALVGGTLTVESRPDGGTTIYARVPLSRKQ